MQISFGERSFRVGVFAWVAIGVIAYLALPWFALEYGLFDATGEEYLDALGWRTCSLSLIAPFSLLAVVPLCLVSNPRPARGRLLVFTAMAGTLSTGEISVLEVRASRFERCAPGVGH